jgi:hypothetical protein
MVLGTSCVFVLPCNNVFHAIRKPDRSSGNAIPVQGGGYMMLLVFGLVLLSSNCCF